jgi:hypothetical protein
MREGVVEAIKLPKFITPSVLEGVLLFDIKDVCC